MSRSFQTIKTEVARCVGTITLNRPEKRNAINALMVRELDQILDAWENDPAIKVVLLKGEGKAFCSGADLAYLQELENFSFDENVQDSQQLSRLFLKIYSYAKPVVAVVQGAALAGGSGLATVCDLIIATPNAKFGYPEVKIGFVAAIVSAFLIRQIGERKARELLLTGNVISAEKALALGLINYVVPEDELSGFIDNLLGQLIANGSLAMRTTKELFSHYNLPKIEEVVEQLAVVNAKFRQTEEFKEGVRAFLEKRRPNWQSRTNREEGLC